MIGPGVTQHTWAPAAAAPMVRLRSGEALIRGIIPIRLAAASGQTTAGSTIPGAQCRIPMCVMVIWDPATAPLR